MTEMRPRVTSGTPQRLPAAVFLPLLQTQACIFSSCGRLDDWSKQRRCGGRPHRSPTSRVRVLRARLPAARDRDQYAAYLSCL